MDWKSIKNERPEIGTPVVIFRGKKRIYVVGKIERLKTPKGHVYGNEIPKQHETNVLHWRSYTGNPLKIDEKDYWLPFPVLTITETFI